MKVGFTVGVWDLFHEGHVDFLKSAREHCDFLYVGIMADFWVKVQKGHDRPFESLELRTVNLRLTGLCDRIVVLDTLDMDPYLQMTDVWIKGVDQKNMRPAMWSNEVFVSRTPNISTTDLGKRIRLSQEKE